MTLLVTDQHLSEAALWRSRFLEQGIQGSLQNPLRPGRTATICRTPLINKSTRAFTQALRSGRRARWREKLANSKASVSRIWRAGSLKPHRVESSKVSNDPQFRETGAIVGRFLKPPEHALVLRVDEKG